MTPFDNGHFPQSAGHVEQSSPSSDSQMALPHSTEQEI